jgi:hypothetical protein
MWLPRCALGHTSGRSRIRKGEGLAELPLTRISRNAHRRPASTDSRIIAAATATNTGPRLAPGPVFVRSPQRRSPYGAHICRFRGVRLMSVRSRTLCCTSILDV